MIEPYYENEHGKLYCGDSLAIIHDLIADGVVVDSVVTDPPYSSGGMMRGDRNAATSAKYQHGDTVDKKPEFAGDTRDQRGWLAWCVLWLSASKKLVKPGGVAAMFTDWRQLPTATDAIQAGGYVWRGIAVWDKGNAIPQPNAFRAQCEYLVWGTHGGRDVDYGGGTYPPGLFSVRSPGQATRTHMTEKPVELMRGILEITKPGDVILDPFAGSGSTLLAAQDSGRKWIGIEISPEYCAICVKRLEGTIRQIDGQQTLFHANTTGQTLAAVPALDDFEQMAMEVR